MTGYESKKAAALDEDGMYLVHHTEQQDATMQSLKDLKRSVCDELGKAAFAQPAQEPVAWGVFDNGDLYEMFFSKEQAEHISRVRLKVSEVRPLYTPPAQPAQERNFCPRCGKRTVDLTTIHTCTPPQEST